MILTYNDRMFSLPHFHFQFKSINISTILTSKLKTLAYVWRHHSWISLECIFLEWNLVQINKSI